MNKSQIIKEIINLRCEIVKKTIDNDKYQNDLPLCRNIKEMLNEKIEDLQKELNKTEYYLNKLVYHA